ncbi:GNAT family N-acetyltransferase [Kineococcus sp. NPDC059986]|uniref:GNAT family N-acetyltransferase n=1 Tax=Kineococcus sp. NPDC059986 TaxID=3155538 RepID=UPI00344EF204
MSLRVAVCTEEDLARLLVGETSRHTAHDHRERFALQAAGRCAYLLAWDGVLNVGRATLLVASKYAPVRERFPGYAEVNALAAFPQGRGTGTALLRRAEELAAARGHDGIGLAVDPDDPGPRRLYERLGYRGWGGGPVVDEWVELLQDGGSRDHADPSEYLAKPL